MPEPHVTVKDVAKAAGVSTATVSRALNKPDMVGADLRARVQKAVRDLGYAPNVTGRALRQQRTDMVSLIIPDIKNAFFTDLTYALERELRAVGLQLVVGNSDEDADAELSFARTAAQQRFAGVILAAASSASRSAELLESRNIPFVLVDRDIPRARAARVLLDNVRAGEMAAEHLCERGYQDPVVLTSRHEISSITQRAEAFIARATDLGLRVSSEAIASVDPREGEALRQIQDYLSTHDSFDSLFAPNGPLTISAYSALSSTRDLRSSPVGLIGVDAGTWTGLVTPSITLISQPIDEMARAVTEALVGGSAAQGDDGTSTTVLSPGLIERDSTTRAS